MTINAEWIAVDWGTSNMRAWAMWAGNSVLARASSARGMGQLRPDEFEAALIEVVEDWLAEGHPTPVIACGMVGARQGWVEADYVAAPTPPIAAPMTRAPSSDPRIEVFIVPGISQSEPPDVMRGEETQIAGFIDRHGDGMVCLPGTHSKWVAVEDGRIAKFRTAMTGETFALLAGQSVLRHSISGEDWDEAAFGAGVAAALDEPAILTQLFSIRAGSLLADTSAGQSRARLSGLLIGAELAGTAAFWREGTVSLIGAPRLSGLYSQALDIAGGRAELLDGEEMTLTGLCAARRLMEKTI